MQWQRVDFQNAQAATGAAVVIDVLRAFTTAAYAFDAGSGPILLASSLEHGLGLAERFPDALLVGEMAGLKPPGFDLPNSPIAVRRQAPLSRRRIILLSGAGTVAAHRVRTEPAYAASLVTARATARRLRAHASAVCLVITGTHCGWRGDEDIACADYLQALVDGGVADPEPIVTRVLNSTHGLQLDNPRHPEYAPADLVAACEVDRFDFAMRIVRKDGLVALEPES